MYIQENSNKAANLASLFLSKVEKRGPND